MRRRETEYTVELETRPMVAFHPEVLVRLQGAARSVGMSDPVFALDESKGSILAVFQVWAATAALALALGCWMFTTTLVKSGIDRRAADVELVVVNKTHDDKQGKPKVRVQLPKENQRT